MDEDIKDQQTEQMEETAINEEIPIDSLADDISTSTEQELIGELLINQTQMNELLGELQSITLILIILLGCIIGLVFIKGLTEVWK